MTTGGRILVECLEIQGVERLFCVPGESYLAVLDALHDSSIETVICRQEGGAAMMAEADGKMTGRPGIAVVTRGPGATNAACGVHVAQQDSTPMILLVGQIGRDMGGRDAFQEVDYRQFFGGMAKWVEEIRDPARIPEVISHAFNVAMSGRPGPVVLALPEDMLSGTCDEAMPARRVEVARPAPSKRDLAKLEKLLANASQPLAIVGGSRWTEVAVAAMRQWAASWDLPVACSFRRQMLFDHLDHGYAGDVGLGINPALKDRIQRADLLLLIGARFSENPSQGFSLLGIPDPGKLLVHVHPGAEELGRIYQPTLAINAVPETFLEMAPSGPCIGDAGSTSTDGRAVTAHAEYLDWSGTPPQTPGDVQMGDVIEWLRDNLPDDAIITNGAGNYATWVHRFYRFRRFGTQLAPTSGSMGYGLPAAIAASLRYPQKRVVCFAGDGCFQMTGQEFADAVQYGAAVIVILVDNGMYGTIRMHQERHYPGRVSGTALRNPDFAALARASGGHGETVTRTDEFADAFERAANSGIATIIHVKIDPEAITPDRSLSQIRDRTG
ncbi:MAG: thiamine pyrophosphate protein [marine bacterium B5-7]|nr:MAG: thiamine pyrophosphate protein [marine bacterium B5-7]